MTIGLLTVQLFISGAQSLKHKRRVIKSLKDKLRNNFNVSIAELDELDKWQKAVLGVVTIGSETGYVNGVLDQTVNFMRRNDDIDVSDYEIYML